MGLARAELDLSSGLPSDDPHRLIALNNLASALSENGEHAEAESILHELLKTETRLYGPECPDTLVTHANLAGTVCLLRKFSEAEEICTSLLPVMKRVLGPDDEGALNVGSTLANAVGDQGRLDDAETLYRDLLAARIQAFGPGHEGTLRGRFNLARNLVDQMRYVEARKVAEVASVDARQSLGLDHPTTCEVDELVALLDFRLSADSEIAAGCAPRCDRICDDAGS